MVLAGMAVGGQVVVRAGAEAGEYRLLPGLRPVPELEGGLAFVQHSDQAVGVFEAEVGPA